MRKLSSQRYLTLAEAMMRYLPSVFRRSACSVRKIGQRDILNADFSKELTKMRLTTDQNELTWNNFPVCHIYIFELFRMTHTNYFLRNKQNKEAQRKHALQGL